MGFTWDVDESSTCSSSSELEISVIVSVEASNSLDSVSDISSITFSETTFALGLLVAEGKIQH